MKTTQTQDVFALLKKLTHIGAALSREKNHTKLLEMILMQAREITHADGATLYVCTKDNRLRFDTLFTESLGLHLGGTSGNLIAFSDLPLYDEAGKPNDSMVATAVATRGRSINIQNAYTEKNFDFAGTYAFDKKNNYQSISFLTIPMRNHLNDVIGVLQLINARDSTTGKIIAFSKASEEIAEALASQAAITVTNHNLIESQKKLFDALIQLIAYAIDKKSPYTAGHCRRVPVITRMIADAVTASDTGVFKDVSLTDDEKYELEVAAWLHDCGKITTPEYVVDKATKLETIFDRVHWVDARFEMLRRDAQIASLQRQIEASGNQVKPDEILNQQLERLATEQAFIRESNIGKESISEEKKNIILRIAQQEWVDSSGMPQCLLTEEEVQNLIIYRGTLTVREREIINNHVVVTLEMLQSLPYPENLKHVPDFAGSHHEKVNGTGYPRGLTGDQMPLQARMIALADVFEALTAQDRPYKKAMPLSQSLIILGQMKVDGHIDPDLFDLFIHAKIYQAYAIKYLDKSSMDAVDLTKIPGYDPWAFQ